MMAKHSISITELTREVTQQTLKVRTLPGDIDEEPANKKVIGLIYFSLGEAAKNKYKHKHPRAVSWDLKA